MKRVHVRVVYVWLGIAIASFGLFFIFYSFPEEISGEYDAFEFHSDNTIDGESVKVIIHGEYKRPLFGANSFSGTIKIDKYDFTDTFDMFDLTFESDTYENMAPLAYTYVQKGKPVVYPFGSIWLLNGEFEQFMIDLHENSQLGITTGTKIAVPALDIEEAIRVETQVNES